MVFGFAAMAAYAILGWAVLVEYAAYIAALGVVFWVSLQIYRSRLLGGAVRVTETTLPELQSVLDEVRTRLNYHKPVDVYVMDKVDGGSSMTSYLGTRLIRIEGGLAADLLGDDHRAELRFMIGRHIGQLKARHQRLLPIMLAISVVDSLKFLQLFLAPYYRATAKSGDQIAAACSGDIQATAGMMNRLLVGKELGPRLVVKGVLDQAAIVKRRWLPRLAQLFQSEPHATNRYLNLLAFFARVAPEEIGRWRASLDEDTASRLTAAINASAHKRAPRRRMSPVALLVATLITGGLLALSGWGIFSVAQAAKAAAGPSGAANTQAGGQARPAAQQPGGGTGSQAANSASSQPANGASSQPGGGTGSAQPASGITATLAAYFNAINARNYQVAWSELSAANQAANPYAQFAARGIQHHHPERVPARHRGRLPAWDLCRRDNLPQPPGSEPGPQLQRLLRRLDAGLHHDPELGPVAHRQRRRRSWRSRVPELRMRSTATAPGYRRTLLSCGDAGCWHGDGQRGGGAGRLGAGSVARSGRRPPGGRAENRHAQQYQQRRRLRIGAEARPELAEALTGHPEGQRQDDTAEDGRPPDARARQHPEADGGLQDHQVQDERDALPGRPRGQVVVQASQPSRCP